MKHITTYFLIIGVHFPANGGVVAWGCRKLSENFFSAIFSSKMQNLQLRKPSFGGNLGENYNIEPRNLLCSKKARDVEKQERKKREGRSKSGRL